MGKLRLKKYEGLVCSKVSGLTSERSSFRSLPGHLLQVISSSWLSFVVRMVTALQGSGKESFDKGLGPEATEGSSEISLRGFSTEILSKVFPRCSGKIGWNPPDQIFGDSGEVNKLHHPNGITLVALWNKAAQAGMQEALSWTGHCLDSFLVYSTVAWLVVGYSCPLILFLFIQLERVMLHSFTFLYLIIRLIVNST